MKIIYIGKDLDSFEKNQNRTSNELLNNVRSIFIKVLKTTAFEQVFFNLENYLLLHINNMQE